MTTTTPFHRADLGDVALEYRERGAGQTVLLVHAGGSGDWFTPMFDEPALDGLRVVQVRRAGYGGSSRPDRHVSIADNARHCADLVRGLGGAAHWVGHSSGGAIALQAALDTPDLVRSLVLLEPAPTPRGPSSAELVERVIGPAMAALGAGDAEGAADIFMRGVARPDYRDLVIQRLGEAALDGLRRDGTYFITEEVRAAIEWEFDAERAARIAVRTLLVTGSEGWRQTRAHAETVELLTPMLPDARAVELPGVGHGMPWEDPDLVARTVAEFVHSIGN